MIMRIFMVFFVFWSWYAFSAITAKEARGLASLADTHPVFEAIQTSAAQGATTIEYNASCEDLPTGRLTNNGFDYKDTEEGVCEISWR